MNFTTSSSSHFSQISCRLVDPYLVFAEHKVTWSHEVHGLYNFNNNDVQDPVLVQKHSQEEEPRGNIHQRNPVDCKISSSIFIIIRVPCTEQPQPPQLFTKSMDPCPILLLASVPLVLSALKVGACAGKGLHSCIQLCDQGVFSGAQGGPSCLLGVVHNLE